MKSNEYISKDSVPILQEKGFAGVDSIDLISYKL